MNGTHLEPEGKGVGREEQEVGEAKPEARDLPTDERAPERLLEPLLEEREDGGVEREGSNGADVGDGFGGEAGGVLVSGLDVVGKALGSRGEQCAERREWGERRG